MRTIPPKHLYIHEAPTPLGKMFIVSDETTVRAIDYHGYETRLHGLLARHYGRFIMSPGDDELGVLPRLRDYFAGDLDALITVPVATNGTEFQRRTWEELRRIPVGETRTYGELASNLGMPRAGRAFGLATGSNPIALAVPCHRVIGADGSLTGYAGGLDRKRWLLEHERAQRSLRSISRVESGVDSRSSARSAVSPR